MVKKFLIFIICFMMFISFVKAEEISSDKVTTSNQNEEKENIQSDDDLLTDGKSAILIEASTGKILYEKNSHERYAPASMTKIMSMKDYLMNQKLN